MKLSQLPEAPHWFATDDGKTLVLREYDVHRDVNHYKITTGLKHPEVDNHNVNITISTKTEFELEELVRRGRKAIDFLIQGS